MKIIDRLIVGSFLKMFLGTLAVLLTLFEVISFFDMIDDFINYHASVGLTVLYFLLRLPEAVLNMAPMAVLIGAILTFSFISRTREVIIMMGSGMSVWRIATPLILASFLISVLNFANGEYLMPPALKKAREILSYKVRHKERRSLVRKNGIWIKSSDRTVWNIDFLEPRTNHARNLTILNFNEKRNGFATIIKAKKAYLKGDVWILLDGYRRDFNAQKGFSETKFKRLDMKSGVRIEELKEVEKLPQEMNFAEIKEYVQIISQAGFDDTRYRVDMYNKIAFPLACLVMAFIAIPFSVKTERVAGVLLGVTMGVFLGFVFWFFQSMGISLGHSGMINPLLAVMAPHILFILYALLQTSRKYGSIFYTLQRGLVKQV